MPPEGQGIMLADDAFLQSIISLARIRGRLEHLAEADADAGARQAAQENLKELADLQSRLSTAYGRLTASAKPLDDVVLKEVMRQAEAIGTDTPAPEIRAALVGLLNIVRIWEGLMPISGEQALNSTAVGGNAGQGPGAVASAPADKPATGAYSVWTADKKGTILNPPTDPKKRDRFPDPADPAASEILFIINNPSVAPPKEQAELVAEIDKVRRITQQLYLEGSAPRPERFRIYYTRLFRLAQLGLEGDAAPLMAADELSVVITDLVGDEAGRVKNGHLKVLGAYVLKYAFPFALAYAVIGLFPDGVVVAGLKRLNVDPNTLAAFAVLWMGCFTGVWLAYGIRKTKITFTDLVTGDEDRLEPQVRLVFAGLLTMLLGMLLVLQVIDLKVGNVSLTDIVEEPMVAFLVGAVCGISELVLPASIGGRAAAIFGSVK